jgi:hypothetical protein
VAPDLSQNIRGKLLEPRRLRRTSCSVLNSAHRGLLSSRNSSSFSCTPTHDLGRRAIELETMSGLIVARVARVRPRQNPMYLFGRPARDTRRGAALRNGGG